MILERKSGFMLKDDSVLTSYAEFQKLSPQSVAEPHIRNIQRFYVTRAFFKKDFQDIWVQASYTSNTADFNCNFDVVGKQNGENYLVWCFPELPSTEEQKVLQTLTKLEDAKLILIFSNLADTLGLRQTFNEAFSQNLFQIKTMIFPPFDNLYEYDIWMFETTFNV